MSGYYTMADAATFKGVSYHTVSRAVRRGKLLATRLGRQALIARADLDAWTPMTERAPKKYGRREPNADVVPVLVGGDAGMSKTIRLEFNEWEAMWVWRMADVMTDLTTMTLGLHEEPAINQSLGEIARQVRDDLSRQGVTGDGMVALEQVP